PCEPTRMRDTTRAIFTVKEQKTIANFGVPIKVFRKSGRHPATKFYLSGIGALKCFHFTTFRLDNNPDAGHHPGILELKTIKRTKPIWSREIFYILRHPATKFYLSGIGALKCFHFTTSRLVNLPGCGTPPKV
ncbi:MAG: hypothetical protein WCW35_07395, partial [Bacteroidota bacterium]